MNLGPLFRKSGADNRKKCFWIHSRYQMLDPGYFENR